MDLIKHGEAAYPAEAWVELQYGQDHGGNERENNTIQVIVILFAGSIFLRVNHKVFLHSHLQKSCLPMAHHQRINQTLPQTWFDATAAALLEASGAPVVVSLDSFEGRTLILTEAAVAWPMGDLCTRKMKTKPKGSLLVSKSPMALMAILMLLLLLLLKLLLLLLQVL